MMILKTMLSVLALGLAAQAAEAQVSGGLRPGRDPIFEPGHPGGGGPFRPGHGGGYRPAPVTESVRMTIGRQYSGFTRLNLSQLLSVAVQGREVQDLTVTMSAQGGRSHAILMENGQAIGQPVIVPNYTIDADFTVQNPNSRTLLELNLNGPVYISEITARVLDVGGGHGGRRGWPGGGHGGPLELSEFVGQNFRGQDFLNLDAVLGLSQYQGMTISKVIIRGSSRAGRGTAELMINGFGQRSMVTLGTGLREHSLPCSRTIAHRHRNQLTRS
jgi:hypothetical protein